MTVKSTLMQINSNSIRNKFDMLTRMINMALRFSWFWKLNLILPLPMLNFSLKDIPLHLDIIEIAMVGEIVLFIREDMPAKTLVKHTIYKRF